MQVRHILPLTGIRLCAALWVVVYHARPCLQTLCPWLKPFQGFFSLGYHAVPFFFLLSGFILSYNYFPAYTLKQHPHFIFYRFARLWPVHLVTLLLFILGPGLIQFKWPVIKSILEELALVRSWFDPDFTWNYPAWSISVEFFAYIFLFPLAFVLFRRIQSLPLLMFLVILLLCGQSFLPINDFPGRCANIPCVFLAGSALYRIHCLLKNPPAQALQIIGVLMFLAYACFSAWLSVFILNAAFALLLLGLATPTGILARLLSHKIIVYGGLVSFSLYMTHALVLRSYYFCSWQNLPESYVLRGLIALALFTVMIATSVMFYRCIEEPANRALRRLVAKKTTEKTAATSPLPVTS